MTDRTHEQDVVVIGRLIELLRQKDALLSDHEVIERVLKYEPRMRRLEEENKRLRELARPYILRYGSPEEIAAFDRTSDE